MAEEYLDGSPVIATGYFSVDEKGMADLAAAIAEEDRRDESRVTGRIFRRLVGDEVEYTLRGVLTFVPCRTSKAQWLEWGESFPDEMRQEVDTL